MNQLTSTTTEIPALTPEGACQIMRALNRTPVPEEFVDRLGDVPGNTSLDNGTWIPGGVNVTRDDVTIDGEPTVWHVWHDRHTDELLWGLWAGLIPCSIEWCEGHRAQHIDEWDDLLHTTPTESIASGPIIDAYGTYAVTIATQADSDGTRVAVRLEYDGDLYARDVEPFAAWLEQVANRIRTQAAGLADKVVTA